MPRSSSPESLDPAQVLLLLDDEDARRRVSAYLGPAHVHEMLAFAARAPVPDGGRRRVLLLHGIMGGQLVDRRGLFGDVVWFDLPQLLYGGGIEELRLAADGRSDAAAGARLEPSRPLRVVYDLLTWHLAAMGGFRVDALAYDWRKAIDDNARRLYAQIEALAEGADDARFSLVAHSMGGVVATRYATLFPDAAARRLEQVVFLGVPTLGCFEPFQLYAGVHPTAARVERVAHGGGESVRQVFATFPGLAELCADPRSFESGALFDPGAWTDVPALGPWLAHARAWRDGVAIPQALLDRLDVVLSANRDTCGGLVRGKDGVEQRWVAGDGSVPTTSAWCPGARSHFESTAHHPLLPLDSAVRAGLVDLLHTRGASAGALPFRATIDALSARTEAADGQPTARPLDAAGPDSLVHAEGVRARTSGGEVAHEDAMWLLGCDGAPPSDRPTLPDWPPPRPLAPGRPGRWRRPG